MKSLIIEIGSYSIRAAIHDGKTTSLLQIGTYNNPYNIPSICTIRKDGKVLWGDLARYWSLFDGSLSYPLIQLENQSLYGEAISELISQVLVDQSSIGLLVFVVPVYWHAMDTKKEFLTKAAEKNGIYKIRFISTPVSVCNKVANFVDQEYSLFYDCGYRGTSISLLQRHGTEVKILDAQFLEETGGCSFDQLILEEINDSHVTFIDDLEHQMLYMTNLEDKAIFMKEYVSNCDTCKIPVNLDTEIFELTASTLHTLIAPKLAKTFQAMIQLLFENNVNKESVHKVYCYGGSCKVLNIINDLQSFVNLQLSPDVKVINLLNENSDYRYLSLYGASIIAQQGPTINF